VIVIVIEYLFLDMDDVIVDLVPAWIKKYNELYDDNLSNEKIVKWDMTKYVKPECGDRIFKILAEPGFIYGLPPINGAIDGIDYLVKWLGVESIYICSASFSGSMVEKVMWIEKYLPALKDNIIFTKKKHVMHTPGSVLIDDGVHNVVDFIKAGGIGCIYDTPHNQSENFPEIKDCTRFHNWNEIVFNILTYHTMF
jgi:5'(3')-deoxyribonucleotidase